MGGRAGYNTVAPALVHAFDRRDPTILWALRLTGCAKVALAVALLVFYRSSPTRSRLRTLGGWGFQLTGAAFVAYGFLEGGAGLLVFTNAIAPLSGWGDGRVAIWYMALWGPFWIAGGLAYLAAGSAIRHADHPIRDRLAATP